MARMKDITPKGGRRFPKYDLAELSKYVGKLCSKTHTNPITIAQLNSGVFGHKANSQNGKIKFSALKQFGLVQGKYAEMRATKLSQTIDLTSGDEKKAALQRAFFNVDVFKTTFETFQNATEDRGKIKHFAVDPIGVHPDKADEFVDSFIKSAKVAGLCTVNGDEVTFVLSQENLVDIVEDGIESEEPEYSTEGDDTDEAPAQSGKQTPMKSGRPDIEIKLDSSLDPDKLEKHLALLKKYGLI